MKVYEFFLGGIEDAEMREIKKVAMDAGCIVHNKSLSWGAKVSDYSGILWTYGPIWAGDGNPRYDGGVDPRHTPVLVELALDEQPPKGAVVIDHHGCRSGEPPAIIQVCNLLGVTPTREQCLIGAMDAGYVYGLQAIGATTEEIADFLGAKNRHGTVSEMLLETEKYPKDIITDADRAVKNAEKVGDLIIIRCNHNTTAPVCSRLFDQQGQQNILILSAWKEKGVLKTEANFFSDGDKVRAVAEKMKCGWTGGAGLMPHTQDSKKFWGQYGGQAPDTAFFGCSGRSSGEVLKNVLSVTD